MAFEQKPESGGLFHNDRRDNESSPHYKGSALIDGKEYWVDGWDNKSKGGKPYIGMRFKPKEQREMPAYKPKPMPAPDPMDFDDVPF